jgi:hypothetical protein
VSDREEWERRVTTRQLQHRYLAALWYWGCIACVRFDEWSRMHTHLPSWLSLLVSLTALALSLWNACR